jgi:transitional endoplasmic reticulum ATPase
MLALAACNELRARGRDVALLRATPGTLLSKFVGESEANVRALFADARREARRCGNCVIFLDEIDALAPARGADGGHNGGASDPLARRVLTELLVCMSDCRRAEAEGAPGRVLVIAATNRPQDLDPACLRRFDRKTLVGLPAEPERMALLQRERTRRALQVNDSALAELAAATAGWSFNDLVALLDEACMCALRDASPEEAMPEVSPRHLQSALASVRQARRDVAPSP